VFIPRNFAMANFADVSVSILKWCQQPTVASKFFVHTQAFVEGTLLDNVIKLRVIFNKK